jgi:hypothetical protein
MLRGALLAILVGAVIGTFAVSTDTFGAGGLFERAVERLDRFIAGPVPDRPTDGTILVPALDARPDAASDVHPAPRGLGNPAPEPTATPTRPRVAVASARHRPKVFAHDSKTWCAPAGVR